MKRILLIVSVLVAACAVSCKKETKVEDAVTIKTDEQVVPVEGGVLSIAINSTVPWTAKASESWVTLSPTSGEAGDATVKASVLKNDTNDSRTATVTFTAGTKTATYSIVQSQLDAMNIATTEFTVAAEGGTVEIPVSANVEYAVIVPDAVDWIHVTSTRGMVDTKITLTVDNTQVYDADDNGAPTFNEDAIVRTAKVTVEGAGQKKEVTIGQKGFIPYFEYTGEWAGLQWSFYEGVPTEIPQEGADITIPVNTNLEWRVYFSVWSNEVGDMVDVWDTEWAHVSFDVAKSEIHLVIDPNDTYFSRDEYLYAECFVDGVSDGNFGGLGQLRQAGKAVSGATASLAWKKTLGELGIPAAYNRLAYKLVGGNALLVSDGDKVHAVNPADGAYYKSIQWTNVKPTSICSDDIGNVIVAETQASANGSTYKVYYAEDVNKDPVELFSHTNDFDGGVIGGWRVRGDITNSAIITALVTMPTGPAYWAGWEFKNKEISLDNYYVQNTAGQNRGPCAGNGLGDPVYGAVIARGTTANEGIFYRGYDGLCNVFFLSTATYPDWVTPYDWKVAAEGGNSGNVNQNNMAIAEYQGKKILAFTQGFHFNYSYDLGYITVMDVTDATNFKTLLTIDATEYLDFNADFLWQSSADVLLRPTADALELYVVNSGLGVLAKFNVTLD